MQQVLEVRVNGSGGHQWHVAPSMVAYHYAQSCKLGTGLDMADLSRILKVKPAISSLHAKS